MDFPGEVRIEGDGLVLREWTPADVPTMVELFDEESVDRWTPLASPFDTDAATRYVERARDARERGICLQLAITTDGGHPLGEVLLFGGDAPDVAEFAWAVGLRHRGRHLAARAVTLVMAYAREHQHVSGFMAKVAPGNESSRRVASETGMMCTDEPAEVRDRKGYRVELAIWRTP